MCTWHSGFELLCLNPGVRELERKAARYKMHPRLCLLWPTKIFLDFVAGNSLACPHKLLLTHYLRTTEHHWKFLKNSQTLQPRPILFTQLENEFHVNGSYCGFVYCKRDIQPKHQLKTHLIHKTYFAEFLWVQTSDCWLYARGVVFLL